MNRITFNQHFGITNETEHLNILMDNDIEVFVDPYHIANNLDSMIAKRMYIRSKSFLETLNRTYIVPSDRKNGLIFLSHLHEPNEYHLGYSDKNKGHGVGKLKSENIYDALSANKFAKTGISITNEAHNVLLLVEGIGQDLMSDILANVCRDILAEFTLKQCFEYGIKTSKRTIEFYDHSSKIWSTKEVELPEYKGKHIILIPQFLASGGRIYQNRYNWFVASNYISRDVLSGKVQLNKNGNFINELKDGTKKAIIKNIHKECKKRKGDLIDFVKTYSGSLLDFQDYVKENYPSVDINKLMQLYGKAS